MVRQSIQAPPPLPKDVSILQLKPETRAGKVFLGQSWRTEREGLPVVYLKGSPLETGYANGVLMQDKMQTLEREFMVMLKGYVPSNWLRTALKNYIFWHNRHL